MKSLIVLLSIFLTNLTFADNTKLGRELVLVKTESGLPTFSVIYTLADDPDGMNWLVSFKPYFSSEELKNLPETLPWNIYLGNADIFLYEWSESRSLKKKLLSFTQLKVSDIEILKLLLVNQPHAYLVLALDTKFHPEYYLSIGKLCEQFPLLFKNLTSSKGCNEITNDDVD